MMQQPSMEVKDKCTGCGTVADLYGSNCGHLTLCLKCGKAMTETAAPCAECGIPVTRLIRAENNRWQGVCLLGVTCQKCTRQKFLESYNTWFMKLLESLKSTDPIFVRAAACASLNDLIVRLGGFIGVAGVRRDGANLVSKLVQPLLQIMGDKGESGIWDDVMDLLSTMLRHFPACLRQHSSSVEALLVARIRDVDCHSSLSEKCAKALALLPKAHGDATTWSSLIRRILIAINYDLDFAFKGMEDAATAECATAALLPRGQDPPLLLGGHSVPANTFIQPGKSLWQQLVPRVALLLQSCNHLLTSPFPVPVPAPLSPLLALAMRILHVDGSRSSLASSLGVTAAQQAALRAELPALHLSALKLLESTLRGVRSHLLPRGADLVRLLTDHFRRCGVAHPSLRIKLYAIARHLFVAMGAGMASALAPAIVGNALSDLKCSMSGANMTLLARGPQNTVLASGGWTGSQGGNLKKRKEPGGMPSHHANRTGDELSVTEEGITPVAVQIAALQALEALLTSGGALLPDRWRAEVDTVLASVAMGAGTGTMSASLMSEETSIMEGTSPCSTSTQFQIAAYQALLASLLSPCCHRPPYLAQALTVFRNGRKEAGTEVAVVCARALLALEPLIHPRSLPPISTPSAVTGRSANGGTFASRLQGFNNSISEPGSMAAVHTSNTANGFAVSGMSSFKIGQMAMDPWAEVDTWLGYGEDCDEDNNVSHPVSKEIHDKGLGNDDHQGVSTPGNKVLSDSELQAALVCVENGVKMHGEITGIIQGNITENQPMPISQSRKTGLDNLLGEEIAGVQDSSISISVELPLQGTLQGIQTASAGQDKEAVTLGVVGITGTSYPVAEVGRIPSADQDTEMCSNIESVNAPTEIVSIQVLDTAHPLVIAGTSTGRTMDIKGDSDNSDSDGPLPDIIDGDPDSDSD